MSGRSQKPYDGRSFAAVFRDDLPGVCSTLSHRQLRVWLALSTFGTWGGGTVYPSMSTLSRLTGIAERHVRTSVSDLENHGLIRRAKVRPGKTTHFELVSVADSLIEDPAPKQSGVTAVSEPRTDSVRGPRTDTVRRTDKDQIKDQINNTVDSLDGPIDAPPLRLIPDEPLGPTDVGHVWVAWLDTHHAYRASSGKRASSPKLSTHRAVIVAALKKHSVDDLQAVILWAHKASGFHAEHLRKGNYLSPSNLFIASKLGDKIAKASDWATDGDPAEAAPRGTYQPGSYS